MRSLTGNQRKGGRQDGVVVFVSVVVVVVVVAAAAAFSSEALAILSIVKYMTSARKHTDATAWVTFNFLAWVHGKGIFDRMPLLDNIVQMNWYIRAGKTMDIGRFAIIIEGYWRCCFAGQVLVCSKVLV
jgi:hypothetical protein